MVFCHGTPWSSWLWRPLDAPVALATELWSWLSVSAALPGRVER
ncbi:hypothetical protein [Amycolatopsis plumensis]|uniref:Uncharacterized protein n=1 Tax=Amycolatopsis plumensis TaxID=236508 RepID=A0ABV5U8D2_9PSEU